jgi:hypothetical protein
MNDSSLDIGRRAATTEPEGNEKKSLSEKLL